MFRLPIICVLAAIAGIAADAAAARQPRPVRKVELISMGRPVTVPVPSADAPEAGEGASAPSKQAIGDAFRVHDLQRRWVEAALASSFGASRLPEAAGDPFAPQQSAGVLPPADAVAAIAVPAWMRGGGFAPVTAPRFVPGCSPLAYRPSGFLTIDSEARRQAYYGMMSAIACQYGIPVGLFDAMIIRESRYNPTIVSPKDAFGLTQLMPDTAAGLGVNRYDVEENLRGGARYLRQQLDHFGQYHLALAAYNAGPGRVRGAIPRISETQLYVADILRNWSRLSGFERAVAVESMTGAPSVRAVSGRAAAISIF